jgi:single-strand DNA-binding protein
MANDINSVVIIGNLTKDCDFGYISSGSAVAKMSIAVNRSKKQADGSYGNEVSYFDVQLWGKVAESLKPYLTKGKRIGVAGSLKQDRWQDKDGKNCSKVVINADNVELLSGDKGEAGNGKAQTTFQNPAQQAEPYPSENYPAQDDSGFPEDIPF